MEFSGLGVTVISVLVTVIIALLRRRLSWTQVAGGEPSKRGPSALFKSTWQGYRSFITHTVTTQGSRLSLMELVWSALRISSKRGPSALFKSTWHGYRAFITHTVTTQGSRFSLMELYLMQNKKEYACCQSYARTSAVLPDMGQTEKERGESHEWTLMFMLPV